MCSLLWNCWTNSWIADGLMRLTACVTSLNGTNCLCESPWRSQLICAGSIKHLDRPEAPGKHLRYVRSSEILKARYRFEEFLYHLIIWNMSPQLTADTHDEKQIHIETANLDLAVWNLARSSYSHAMSWMKMIEFRFKVYWNSFPGVHLSISHHWFR